jgi:hypothetical protein
MLDGRRSVTMILAATAAAGLTAVTGSGGATAGTRAAAAPRAALTGAWGTAQEMPGTAALNQGGDAQVNSVSCSSPGNCSAGGFYTDSTGGNQAFVDREVKGTWRAPIEVPGTAALNKYEYAWINSVSCASAGNCSAGGFYANNGLQPFVVSEINGIWHKAIEVPGSAVLNRRGGASVQSVSCAKPGDCSAGGYYLAKNFQAFVASEVNGIWQKAIQVPGTASIPPSGDATPTAEVNSVSCVSAGNCTIGGSYDVSSTVQAFVASEVNGIWHKAREVPGSAALNLGDYAEVNSVSCGSAGNCSAGGYYTDSRGYEQLMGVNEVNGTWHNAIEIPGTAALNLGDNVQVSSVSCASAGNCSAGGWYMGSSSLDKPFVVNEVNGTWHNAIEVPGMAALTTGSIFGEVVSVSCSSAGNCSAGGWYTDSSDHGQPFVVNEVNGTWRNAIEVPGITTLNQGGTAAINAMSCAPAGSCSAIGFYTDSSQHRQLFVVSKN